MNRYPIAYRVQAVTRYTKYRYAGYDSVYFSRLKGEFMIRRVRKRAIVVQKRRELSPNIHTFKYAGFIWHVMHNSALDTPPYQEVERFTLGLEGMEGSATYVGKPTQDTIDAVQAMAELAYKTMK